MMAQFMAALKAIAAIPQILEQIRDARINLSNEITERKLERINRKVNELTARLPHGKDRDEILDLVSELNDTISK